MGADESTPMFMSRTLRNGEPGRLHFRGESGFSLLAKRPITVVVRP